jgi:tetratricopeptide (TPR) repeat protein
VDLLTKAVAANPKDYASYFHLGLAHTFLNQDAEAIAAYRKALALRPGLYEASLNLGIVLLRAKQPADAIDPLKAAATAKPDQPRPRFYLAEAYRETKQFALAEPEYRKADPTQAATHAGLGSTLLALGRHTDAEAAFRQAAAIDPAYRAALLELAQAYEAKGEAAKAIALYRQFEADPAARERAGVLALEAGDLDSAITDLEFAVAQSPTPANRLALATAYVRKKDPAKSAALLEAALKQEPGNRALRMMLGRILRDQYNYAGAAGHFAAVLKTAPDDREALREITGMLISLKEYGQALAALDRLNALGENQSSHDYFRALIHDQMRNYKSAYESYRNFLARSEGKFPDEEFKARQRLRIIEKELSRR